MKKLILSLLLAVGCLSAMAAPTNSASSTLAWDVVPSATSYKLYVGTAPRTYSSVFPASTSILQVTNLNWGGTYYYAVTAVNSNLPPSVAESAYSNEITNTFPTLPAAPTNLRITGY